MDSKTSFLKLRDEVLYLAQNVKDEDMFSEDFMKILKGATLIFLLLIVAPVLVNANEIFGNWECLVGKDVETDEIAGWLSTTSMDKKASLSVRVRSMPDNVQGMKGKRIVFWITDAKYLYDKKIPIIKIDKNKPFPISHFDTEGHNHFWKWGFEYSKNPEVFQNKNLLNPMKNGTIMRFKYYPLGLEEKEVVFQLNGFKDAFNWLVNQHP